MGGGPTARPHELCLAKRIPSLRYAFDRWYSIVFGDRNSWAAASALVAPPATTSATCSSCGVSCKGAKKKKRSGGATAAGLDRRRTGRSRSTRGPPNRKMPTAEKPRTRVPATRSSASARSTQAVAPRRTKPRRARARGAAVGAREHAQRPQLLVDQEPHVVARDAPAVLLAHDVGDRLDVALAVARLGHQVEELRELHDLAVGAAREVRGDFETRALELADQLDPVGALHGDGFRRAHRRH